MEEGSAHFSAPPQQARNNIDAHRSQDTNEVTPLNSRQSSEPPLHGMVAAEPISRARELIQAAWSKQNQQQLAFDLLTCFHDQTLTLARSSLTQAKTLLGTLHPPIRDGIRGCVQHELSAKYDHNIAALSKWHDKDKTYWPSVSLLLLYGLFGPALISRKFLAALKSLARSRIAFDEAWTLLLNRHHSEGHDHSGEKHWTVAVIEQTRLAWESAELDVQTPAAAGEEDKVAPAAPTRTAHRNAEAAARPFPLEPLQIGGDRDHSPHDMLESAHAQHAVEWSEDGNSEDNDSNAHDDEELLDPPSTPFVHGGATDDHQNRNPPGSAAVSVSMSPEQGRHAPTPVPDESLLFIDADEQSPGRPHGDTMKRCASPSVTAYQNTSKKRQGHGRQSSIVDIGGVGGLTTRPFQLHRIGARPTVRKYGGTLAIQRDVAQTKSSRSTTPRPLEAQQKQALPQLVPTTRGEPTQDGSRDDQQPAPDLPGDFKLPALPTTLDVDACRIVAQRLLDPKSWIDDEGINTALVAVNPDPQRCGIVRSGFTVGGFSSKPPDLDGCEMLVFPVHLTNHWTAALARVNDHTITVFDPLHIEASRNLTFQRVRTFLDQHFPTETAWSRVDEPTALQQVDQVNCGIFSLIYLIFRMHNMEMPKNLSPAWRPLFASLFAVDHEHLVAALSSGSLRLTTTLGTIVATSDSINEASQALKRAKLDIQDMREQNEAAHTILAQCIRSTASLMQAFTKNQSICQKYAGIINDMQQCGFPESVVASNRTALAEQHRALRQSHRRIYTAVVGPIDTALARLSQVVVVQTKELRDLEARYQEQVKRLGETKKDYVTQLQRQKEDFARERSEFETQLKLRNDRVDNELEKLVGT